MAIAQIIYGNIAPEHAVMSVDFKSVELNSGETFTFTEASKQYVLVSAFSDLYVAFTTDGTAPNAASAPRVKITAGTFFPFSIRTGAKLAVVSA